MDLSLWSSIVRLVSAVGADWTSAVQHDPGITLVQAFAFLVDSAMTYLRSPLP